MSSRPHAAWRGAKHRDIRPYDDIVPPGKTWQESFGTGCPRSGKGAAGVSHPAGARCATSSRSRAGCSQMGVQPSPERARSGHAHIVVKARGGSRDEP